MQVWSVILDYLLQNSWGRSSASLRPRQRRDGLLLPAAAVHPSADPPVEPASDSDGERLEGGVSAGGGRRADRRARVRGGRRCRRDDGGLHRDPHERDRGHERKRTGDPSIARHPLQTDALRERVSTVRSVPLGPVQRIAGRCRRRDRQRRTAEQRDQGLLHHHARGELHGLQGEEHGRAGHAEPHHPVGQRRTLYVVSATSAMPTCSEEM